jgi:hypothetical protein
MASPEFNWIYNNARAAAKLIGADVEADLILKVRDAFGGMTAGVIVNWLNTEFKTTDDLFSWAMEMLDENFTQPQLNDEPPVDAAQEEQELKEELTQLFANFVPYVARSATSSVASILQNLVRGVNPVSKKKSSQKTSKTSTDTSIDSTPVIAEPETGLNKLGKAIARFFGMAFRWLINFIKEVWKDFLSVTGLDTYLKERREEQAEKQAEVVIRLMHDPYHARMWRQLIEAAVFQMSGKPRPKDQTTTAFAAL